VLSQVKAGEFTKKAKFLDKDTGTESGRVGPGFLGTAAPANPGFTSVSYFLAH
jgi:hypothetical protein